jgi:hypothetical protein
MGTLLVLLLAGLILGTGVIVWRRRRHRRALAAYHRELESALADGVITDDEARELEELRARGRLSHAEVRMAGLTVYRRALREAAADGRLTAAEDEGLSRLQAQLGLSSAELRSDLPQLQRLRLLARIERGQLPRVEQECGTEVDETCHWVIRGTLCRLLSGPAFPDGVPAGEFHTLDGDPSLRTDAERALLAPDPRILPEDPGIVIVTSRRIIFRGAKRKLTLPHLRLLSVTLHGDGLRLDLEDSGSPFFLLVEDPELTAAILLRAARHRHAELRGTPLRSA